MAHSHVFDKFFRKHSRDKVKGDKVCLNLARCALKSGLCTEQHGTAQVFASVLISHSASLLGQLRTGLVRQNLDK